MKMPPTRTDLRSHFSVVLAGGVFAIAAIAATAAPAAETVQQVYQDALRAYMRGDLDVAEAGLQRVVAADPRHTAARQYLDRIRYQRKTMAQTNPGMLIQRKMEAVIAPLIDFEGASLESVLEFIAAKTEELTEKNFRPNFIFKGPSGELRRKTVTMKVSNMPMSEVLRYIGDSTEIQFTYEAHAIVVTPKR
ncbi:MAG: hypothetical protein ACC661_02330, partial [Verrucomicrobiales bacterium]